MRLCEWYACVRVRNSLIGTRTDTRGCLRVHGKPGLATLAHGRAVSGAGGDGFGITVRASASVDCTDKHGVQTLIRV